MTVCLRPGFADVDAAVRAALAPYDINAYPDYNPAWRWDWWDIYTPPDRRLRVRPEHDGDPRLIHNPVFLNGEPRPGEPLRCDGGPKGMLDIPSMTADAVHRAEELWDAWQALVASHPPAEPLSAFLRRYADRPEQERLALARADHLKQPLVQAIAQRAVRGDAYFSTQFLVHDPVAYFACDRQEYIDQTADAVLFTFALLRLDGAWVDVDNIAEFVPISPEEHREQAYRRYQRRYLDALAEDTTIVLVRCHG